MCAACGRQHLLHRTPEAERSALALLARIDAHGRFDILDSSGAPPDPRFSTDGRASGKMLGVLTCSDGSVLHAFSGLLGGTAYCPGWVGPVRTPLEDSSDYSDRFQKIVEHVKAAAESEEPERGEHRRIHRKLSAQLSAELEDSIVLRNSRDQSARLRDVLALQPARASGGVGDCAAPKLLMAAFERGLRPAAMAEVWHEAPARRHARPRRREHGSFHQACKERCAPIMGFLLCGLDGPAHCGEQ